MNFGIGFEERPLHLPVGQDTTRAVAPLTEDGGLDFVEYLNQRLSKGVTPENNALVLMTRISGARLTNEKFREQFRDRIGVDSIPDEGKWNWSILDEYGVELIEYVNQRGADWAYVSRLLNRHFDKYADVWRRRDKAAIIACKQQADFEAEANDVYSILAFSLGPGHKAKMWAQRLLSFGGPDLSLYQDVENRSIANLDATRIMFALAIYQHDKGEYPDKLAQLVPQYLPELPKDRITDMDFIYRREKASFVLYSRYHDKIDDGGDFSRGADLPFFIPGSDNKSYEQFIKEHPVDRDLIEKVRLIFTAK